MSTIGTTGRDYSTLQAWEDAIAADLSAGGEVLGECYNDSEFTGACYISGHSNASGTDFIHLTCASGQSFQDNASIQTTALVYNQSNGVGVSANPFAAPIIDCETDYTQIERLQVKRTGASYSAQAISFDALGNCLLKDCIVVKTFAESSDIVAVRGNTAVNVLSYCTSTNCGTGISVVSGGSIIGCTAAVDTTNSASGTGFSTGYTGNIAKNCASFGWTTDFSASGWAGSSDYNASDSTGSPGANSTDSLTYSSQFESTTGDWRLKTGAGLIDAGNRDATYTTDIAGTTRGATTSCDVGCWEFVAAGGATGKSNPLNGPLGGPLTGAIGL